MARGLNITATATDPGGNTSEFSAPAAVQGSTTNVTSELSSKFGGFVYNRTTGRFTQTLTITNISGAAITGPIELVLLDLKNATLVNQSGTTRGNPYITGLLHHHRKSMNIKELRIRTWVYASDCPARSYAQSVAPGAVSSLLQATYVDQEKQRKSCPYKDLCLYC